MSDSLSQHRYAAIVFDLDGVLILSRDCHRQAFEEVLGEYGVTGFDYGEFAGWRTPEVFREMFARHPEAWQSIDGVAREAQIADCSTRKTARARQLIDADFPLAPGCVEAVRGLAARGYRLGLASSGSRSSVEAFLSHTGLADAFDSVLSGSDVLRAKPDPELFLRSISNLGVPCGQCLIVEDAVAGVKAALAAGASAVGIAEPGSGDASQLLAAGAVDVMPEARGIAAFLDQVGKAA